MARSRFMRYADLKAMLQGMNAIESSREVDLILDLVGMPEVQGDERMFLPEIAAILYSREFNGPDRPETYVCRIQVMEVSPEEQYESATWMSPTPEDPTPKAAPEWVTALVALHGPDWYPRHEEALPRVEAAGPRLRSV